MSLLLLEQRMRILSRSFIVARVPGTKPFDVCSKPTPAGRAQSQVVVRSLAGVCECVYYRPRASVLLIYH